MDKEPLMIRVMGEEKCHISVGPSPVTGFRDESLCGVKRNDFQSVGPVKFLPDHEHDLLCAECLGKWGDQPAEVV